MTVLPCASSGGNEVEAAPLPKFISCVTGFVLWGSWGSAEPTESLQPHHPKDNPERCVFTGISAPCASSPGIFLLATARREVAMAESSDSSCCWRKAELPAWRTFQAPAGAGSGSLREQSLAFEAGEAAECTAAAAEGLRAVLQQPPNPSTPQPWVS